MSSVDNDNYDTRFKETFLCYSSIRTARVRPQVALRILYFYHTTAILELFHMARANFFRFQTFKTVSVKLANRFKKILRIQFECI